MFRRDKNSKLDNEGLRRMRDAIRHRLEQEETAGTPPATGDTTEQTYRPTPPAEGAYTYENLPTEPDYSFLHETTDPGSGVTEHTPSDAATLTDVTLPAVSAPPAEAPWQSRSPEPAPAPKPAMTTVAAGTTWRGTLRSSSNVHVEGSFEGELEVEQTLYIAPAATVNASVRATTIVVAGTLSGQVECQERLEILPSGHVSGQIQAGRIAVQEGAFLGGQLRMKGQEGSEQDDPARPMLQRIR